MRSANNSQILASSYLQNYLKIITNLMSRYTNSCPKNECYSICKYLQEFSEWGMRSANTSQIL